jgi:hypothetical protein
MACNMGGPVHSLMLGIAPSGMDVLLEFTLQVNEAAPSGAISILIEGGEVDGVACQCP